MDYKAPNCVDSSPEEQERLLSDHRSSSEVTIVRPAYRYNSKSSIPNSPRRSNYSSKYGKKDSAILGVLAAQTLKIASINGIGEIDRLENELEDEIRYENRSPSKTAFGRARRKGQHQLHSKFVLLLVVVLNIVDCLLVMATLTLDFHYVSDRLKRKEDMLQEFRDKMVLKHDYDYLTSLPSDMIHDAHTFLQAVMDSTILWDRNDISPTSLTSECAQILNQSAQALGENMTSLLRSNWSSSSPSQCFQMYGANQSTEASKPGSEFYMYEDGHTDEKLTEVAHKLHYCSIGILAALEIIVIMKIICNGKRFFRHRLQVFDGCIITISFIIDVVFIEGVTIMDVNEFVIILTFLLPWRILRVLNSLVAAVLDQQHLNLKIIYTQKKKIGRSLTESNSKVNLMQRHIEVLQNLCSSRGVAETEVRRALGREISNPGNKSGGGGLSSMLALGKLAFQTADAFTPLTQTPKPTPVRSNGSVKNNTQETSTSSSCSADGKDDVSLNTSGIGEGSENVAPDSSRSTTSSSDGGGGGDKNNPVVFTLSGNGVQDPTLKSDPDMVTLRIEDPEEYSNDTITGSLHSNGSGPPRANANTENSLHKNNVVDDNGNEELPNISVTTSSNHTSTAENLSPNDNEHVSRL